MVKKDVVETYNTTYTYCDRCGERITNYDFRGEPYVVCGKDVCEKCGFLYHTISELSHDGYDYKSQSKRIVVCRKHNDRIDIFLYEKRIQKIFGEANKKIEALNVSSIKLVSNNED